MNTNNNLLVLKGVAFAAAITIMTAVLMIPVRAEITEYKRPDEGSYTVLCQALKGKTRYALFVMKGRLTKEKLTFDDLKQGLAYVDQKKTGEGEYQLIFNVYVPDDDTYTVYLSNPDSTNGAEILAYLLPGEEGSSGDNDGKKDDISDKKVEPVPNAAFASSQDNFSPVISAGNIKKLILDFSNVRNSGINPAALTMTVIKGSHLITTQEVGDPQGVRTDGGVKVKVNKKTKKAVVTCKSKGSVTLPMEDGTTYTVAFTVEKPKPNKQLKTIPIGAEPKLLDISDLFNTSLDLGKLEKVRGNGDSALSGNCLQLKTDKKDSLKLRYSYLNKKYNMAIKIK